MTTAAANETHLGAGETASAALSSSAPSAEEQLSFEESAALDKPISHDPEKQAQAQTGEQQYQQEPAQGKEGLVWNDITFDIPLSRKARKAAVAASKDPSSNAEKGSVDTAAAAKDTIAKANEPGWRRILDHVSGSVRPGEMVAILGASGAGKTTLLNILSARVGSKGRLDGKVLFHGDKRDPGTWKRTLGYVEQDDLLHAQLTVHETLSFAAKLRLPSKHFPPQAKEERVEETIDMLRLEKCRDTRVGSEGNRGISGGERKRASIAAELLSDVETLFLDEPTSGLDAFQALNIIENLKEVTRKRNLITLATIHQPSWRVFNMFDRVILLTRGGVFFDAPPALTVPYFASFGHDVPEGVNPADHYIQIADAFEKTEQAEQRVRGLLAHWKTSEAQALMAKLKADDASERAQARQSANFSRPEFGMRARKFSSRQMADLSEEKRVRTFEEWPSLWGYELLVLAHRDFLLQIRNPAILFGTIGQTVVLLILIGFSFFRLGYDQGGVLGRIGLLFFVLINSSFSILFPILTVFPLAHAIMKRERSAGMYRTSSFFLAKLMVEIPSQILQRCWYYIILYWMAGLKAEAGPYFTWLAINTVAVLISISQGYMIGSLSPDIQIANIIAPLLNVIFLLFAGNLLPTNSIPPWLRWLRFISFIGYGYSALAQNEFSGLTFNCNGSGGATSPQCYQNGEQVLAAYDLNIFTLWENVGFMCAIMSVFLGLTYIFLRFLGHPRFRYV